MEESLRDMLKHGRRFERLRTTIPGVFFRKIPQYKDEPAYLALEINPIGKSGSPMNKIGAIIRSKEELDAIRVILSKDELDDAIRVLEQVNGYHSEEE